MVYEVAILTSKIALQVVLGSLAKRISFKISTESFQQARKAMIPLISPL
jgi:hypothetical protein